MKWLALIAFLAVVQLAGSAAAGEPLPGTERTTDPRAMALANSLRASSANTTGVYLNPATMSMAHVYHIAAKYQFTGRDYVHNPGLVFLDSITSTKIAAGASLDYRKDSASKSDFESWDARLALSTGIAGKFFIGLTGRYLRAAHDIERSSRGPNGSPALPRSGNIQANGFTFDAGVAARLGEMITLGIVGSNLTNTGTLYAPVLLGSGLSVNIRQMLLVESDVEFDFTSYENVGVRLSFGAELVLKEQLSIRAGYAHDFFMEINQVTAGLGYTTKRFAVDLGYMQDIEFKERFRLALGFRIFIG